MGMAKHILMDKRSNSSNKIDKFRKSKPIVNRRLICYVQNDTKDSIQYIEAYDMVNSKLVWHRRVDGNLICMRHEQSLFSFQSFNEMVFIRYDYNDEAENLALLMKRFLKVDPTKNFALNNKSDKKNYLGRNNEKNILRYFKKRDFKKICNKVLPKKIRFETIEPEDKYKYGSLDLESEGSMSENDEGLIEGTLKDRRKKNSNPDEDNYRNSSVYGFEYSVHSARRFDEYKGYDDGVYGFQGYEMYTCTGYVLAEGMKVIKY